MTEYAVALVGTGDTSDTGPDGLIAYQHADAYESIDTCKLVACADIVRENAEAFATEHGIADAHVYEDHATTLSAVDPDVVSISAPPAAHAAVAVDYTRRYGRSTVRSRRRSPGRWPRWPPGGTQLTFNHQHRFGKPFRSRRVFSTRET